MPQPADRNLLFGILALQMDFVGRDDLIAAMHAWAIDKGKSLAQILSESGKLADDERALLDALVGKHLEKHGHDPQRSLAALPPVGRLRDELRQLPDADLHASLDHVAATPTGPDPDGTVSHAPPAARPPHARFHILRPHARGGLGEVFVARDEELKREVALKEIQERHADNPESRTRFLLEAEVTGGLEHPGIVPVYGLGAYADGRPFYAMRFIRGDSLKDAIRAFHEADRRGRAAAERSLALRQLLGRFVDVCDAVAYAHSRGVLHRDLKPANVMLGQYGETLVVDWGLAKVIGRPEAAADGPPAAGDPSLTQAGRALGTPAYMSPEQAEGRLDRLGPRSDVYSLGATLYCLLAGRAPFADADTGELLRRVQKGEFQPPRRVARQVPPALEAVCLEAMALRPEDRYATPRELAEEIERWLADEPVRAYREPLTARLGRWVRRRQTLAAGVGALLLTGVIALAISTILVGQAQQETALALKKEERARQATAEALKKEEAARKGRALDQVEALLHADPQAVPALLAGLAATREDVLPRLRELWAPEAGGVERNRKGRVGLALLPVQPALVKNWLFSWMLEADDPREVLLLRDGLRPHRVELREWLWERADRDPTREQGFRALVALAAYDPDNGRWKELGDAVLEQLLTANPLHLGTWTEALRPVRAALRQPLAEVFRGRKRAEHKQVAATLLAEYAADQPELLAELVLEADGGQYAALRQSLSAQWEAVEPRLRAALRETAGAKASDEDKDRLAFRQANAALALGVSHEEDEFWRLLRHSADPSLRTYLIDHFRPYGVDPNVLRLRYLRETEASVRRALLIALGDCDWRRINPTLQKILVARLVKEHQDDPDPGVHGAIEWMLRQWKEDGKLPKLRNHKPKDAPKGKPTWYVNGQGQTMTVIPGPVEFLMGSSQTDPDRAPIETPHRRKIPRSFAIATKEVTVADFRRFLQANPEVDKRFFGARDYTAGFLKKYSPEEDGPIILVSWYTAAAYCNWLSQQERLPEQEWCYPKDLSKIRPGMAMEEGFLQRKGYRLPTEAEWEYACRAGAVTSRYYGRCEALLGKYAWYQGTSGQRAQRVGLLRPNDLGLFDMLGNVAEWCQDRYWGYPEGEMGEAVEDGEDKDLKDATTRMTRGGAFAAHASTARSAVRPAEPPTNRGPLLGLRVARTCD